MGNARLVMLRGQWAAAGRQERIELEEEQMERREVRTARERGGEGMGEGRRTMIIDKGRGGAAIQTGRGEEWRNRSQPSFCTKLSCG